MSQVLAFLSAAAILTTVGVTIASLIINCITLSNVNTVNELVKNITNGNNSWHYTPAPEPSKGNVSTDPGFKAAASLLLNGIDDTVDPCEDFYAFTCSKYLKNTDLNKLKLPRLGTYLQAQQIVYNETAAELDKFQVDSTTVSMTERITKAAFEICKNGMSKETDRTADIYKEIKDNFGGAPFLGENIDQNLNYYLLAGKFEQEHALGTLSYSIATADYNNHSKNALYIGQPELSLPRDFYVKPQYVAEVNKRVESVKELLKSFANAKKSEVKEDAIQKAAEETVNFEVQIAMASWPDDLMRNYRQQYNPFTFDSLTKAYPNIEWKRYFEQLFSTVQADYSKYTLVLTQPSYFAWLNSVFGGSTVNSTVIANYMITQLIAESADFIHPATKEANKNYVPYSMRAGRGITKIGRRTVRAFDSNESVQDCLDLITNYMPYGTGFVYVKSKSQKNDVKNDVKKQTDLIIQNFQGMIDSLHWMTDETKDRAHNKSSSLIKNFGWPDELFGDFKDTSKLDDYHKDYEAIINLYKEDPSNSYKLTKLLKKGMENREFFRILDEPGKRENFLASPATVNAWYQPERNSITFPYAAWNPPYYNYGFPQAYNFAGQGGTGGHELTHGYDDEGVQFGFNGELTDCSWNKCGWMDTNSSAGFVDMAQCVVTQFSTKCCPEKIGNVHCANGATTQGENIADLGGQQAAYRAYRQYIKEERNGVEEDRLPGLEYYTPNQIFWITYGYSWCMKQTDENLVQQLLTNPHSPAKCRTNQVMQDIPEFGKDFGCKRGQPMFPIDSDRCKVWVGK